MRAKRLIVFLAAPAAAAAVLLPQSAASQASAATPAPATVTRVLSPTVTPYAQGYKDGYRDGLKYARDCRRGDPRGRAGLPGHSAEYNRGYVDGIIAAYRYGHRVYCGFGPGQ